MALFQLSYKDHIKKLTAESREREQKNISSSLDEIQLYRSYIYDLSTSIQPLDNVLMYKRINANRCSYSLQLLDISDCEKKHVDIYGELLQILRPIFSTEITTNFLTGYYFAKLLIKQAVKSIDGCVSFHFGCSDLQLITGIEKQIGKSVGKWKWFGADLIMGSPVRYLNGINKTGDLNNIDVIKSIRNQLGEVLKHKLTFYISDIRPNLHQLYNSIIIPLMDVDVSGFSILRLPDLPDWHDLSTHMINFILLCTSHYTYCKIFATPWGSKTRYYLILATPKSIFTIVKYVALIKYLEVLKDMRKEGASIYPLLYSKNVFTNDLTVETFVANYIDIYHMLTKHVELITPIDANKIWFDLIMSYPGEKK